MPPARKKPKPPEERKRPRAGTTYPSAPKDPTERRQHFSTRNALIAGVDPDEYQAAIEAQLKRAREHGDQDLHALRKSDR